MPDILGLFCNFFNKNFFPFDYNRPHNCIASGEDLTFASVLTNVSELLLQVFGLNFHSLSTAQKSFNEAGSYQ